MLTSAADHVYFACIAKTVSQQIITVTKLKHNFTFLHLYCEISTR